MFTSPVRHHTIRVLLLADSHLGFGVQGRRATTVDDVRRARAAEFEANYRRALERAHASDIDLVVHGGDLFHRSRVSAALAQRAYQPLVEVASHGTPVCVVPGNHERARLPWPLLRQARQLHVFDRPRTFCLRLADLDVAVGGVPFMRSVGGTHFAEAIEASGLTTTEADIRIACLHQAVEGAVVGAQNYVFRRGRDVVPASALPSNVAACLSGHIHRRQVLERALDGRRLAAPVIYPGSLERTSIAERKEAKGYTVLELTADSAGGHLDDVRVTTLPTRPMLKLDLQLASWSAATLSARVEELVVRLERPHVIHVTVHGCAVRPDGTQLLKRLSDLRSGPHLLRVRPSRADIELWQSRRRGGSAVGEESVEQL